MALAFYGGRHGRVREHSALARVTARGVEGHVRDTAPLGSDRRQSASDPVAVAQSLLACDALRYRSRADDWTNPALGEHVPDRIRLSKSPVDHLDVKFDLERVRPVPDWSSRDRKSTRLNSSH